VAMEALAVRFEPAEVNHIGFRLYERFRPEVPAGNKGWSAKAVLEIEKILTAAYAQISSWMIRRS
jgi:hypothetical protein